MPEPLELGDESFRDPAGVGTSGAEGHLRHRLCDALCMPGLGTALSAKGSSGAGHARDGVVANAITSAWLA